MRAAAKWLLESLLQTINPSMENPGATAEDLINAPGEIAESIRDEIRPRFRRLESRLRRRNAKIQNYIRLQLDLRSNYPRPQGRFRPRRPFRPQVIIAAVAVVIIFATTAIAAWVLVGVALHSEKLNDRLAAATLVTTAGALALAVVAAIVAISAYSESLHRPDLLLVGRINDHDALTDALLTVDESTRWPPDGKSLKATTIALTIHNVGDTVARHVFVSLYFGGFDLVVDEEPEDWVVAAEWTHSRNKASAALSLSWFGGDRRVVYPGVPLILPLVDLKNLYAVNDEMRPGAQPLKMGMLVAADGAVPFDRMVDIRLWDPQEPQSDVIDV